MAKHVIAGIGDCLGSRFLYGSFVYSDRFDLGSFLAWECSSTLCVKSYKDGRLVMRKALEFWL